MRTVVTAVLQQTARQRFGSQLLVSDGPAPVTRKQPHAGSGTHEQQLVSVPVRGWPLHRNPDRLDAEYLSWSRSAEGCDGAWFRAVGDRHHHAASGADV